MLLGRDTLSLGTELCGIIIIHQVELTLSLGDTLSLGQSYAFTRWSCVVTRYSRPCHQVALSLSSTALSLDEDGTVTKWSHQMELVTRWSCTVPNSACQVLPSYQIQTTIQCWGRLISIRRLSLQYYIHLFEIETKQLSLHDSYCYYSYLT